MLRHQDFRSELLREFDAATRRKKRSVVVQCEKLVRSLRKL